MPKCSNDEKSILGLSSPLKVNIYKFRILIKQTAQRKIKKCYYLYVFDESYKKDVRLNLSVTL